MEDTQKDNCLETWPKGKRITLRKSHPHSLADLIMALSKLSPSDEEATNAILEILGIRLEPEFTKMKFNQCHEATPDLSPYEDNEDKESIQTKPTFITPPEESKKSTEAAVTSELIPLEKSHDGLPTWFHHPLSLENKAGSSCLIASYPLQTLFVPNWTRALLISALSNYDSIGPINMDEIIKIISENKPLTEIPRIPWPTMVHGVQVLIDESESLEPFHKDQVYLKNIVLKVAGSDRTEIMGFIGCPLWGVQHGKFNDWSDYHPPSSRTTVLIMTDLGILRNPDIIDRAGVRDWLHFAAIVRDAGCSLVAFVPYPSERWPKPLKDVMKIVQWDRTTSISTIQQIFKKVL